jgi:hypothetical protein
MMPQRWDDVDSQEIFDMTVKMYRDPFVPASTIVAAEKNLELDHYAYKYLGTELFMYRILDTNFEKFIEERGDMFRVGSVEIPTEEDTTKTIL